MNIFQVIQSNPDLIAQVQKAVSDTLRGYSKCNLEAKPSFLKDDNNKFKITILSMLNLSTKAVDQGGLALGFTEAAFMKIYESTLNMKAEGINAETGDLAGELINIIYQTITPELRKKGVTFDVSLPTVLLENQLSDWAKVAVDRSLVFPFSSDQGDLYFEIPEITEAPPAQPQKNAPLVQVQQAAAFPTRILLVDDSGTTRKISKKALSELGYSNIIEAADGEAAWQLIVQGNPPVQLVITDWHMPKLTGLQLLENIRRHPETKNLPVVMVTAERNKEEVAKIVKLGAQGYLVKPFDQAALQKFVDKIVNK
ncbi:response regulator [Bdellovibrionota bacterium FG-2]